MPKQVFDQSYGKTNFWKLNKCLKHIHNTKFYQEIYIMKNISIFK